MQFSVNSKLRNRAKSIVHCSLLPWGWINFLFFFLTHYLALWSIHISPSLFFSWSPIYEFLLCMNARCNSFIHSAFVGMQKRQAHLWITQVQQRAREENGLKSLKECRESLSEKLPGWGLPSCNSSRKALQNPQFQCNLSPWFRAWNWCSLSGTFGPMCWPCCIARALSSSHFGILRAGHGFPALLPGVGGLEIYDELCWFFPYKKSVIQWV